MARVPGPGCGLSCGWRAVGRDSCVVVCAGPVERWCEIGGRLGPGFRAQRLISRPQASSGRRAHGSDLKLRASSGRRARDVGPELWAGWLAAPRMPPPAYGVLVRLAENFPSNLAARSARRAPGQPSSPGSVSPRTPNSPALPNVVARLTAAGSVTVRHLRRPHRRSGGNAFGNRFGDSHTGAPHVVLRFAACHPHPGGVPPTPFAGAPTGHPQPSARRATRAVGWSVSDDVTGKTGVRHWL